MSFVTCNNVYRPPLTHSFCQLQFPLPFQRPSHFRFQPPSHFRFQPPSHFHFQSLVMNDKNAISKYTSFTNEKKRPGDDDDDLCYEYDY